MAQINRTGEQVLSRPVPQEVPMTILVALQPVKNNSPQATDANAKRLDFQRLYPKANFIQVKSGHGIPQEHPELVVNAIRDLLHPPMKMDQAALFPASTAKLNPLTPIRPNKP